MTYQPMWGPAQLNPVAQSKSYARARLSKLFSLAACQAVPGWIWSTIVGLVVPATQSAQPDWHRQLRNDVLKVKARRLL